MRLTLALPLSLAALGCTRPAVAPAPEPIAVTRDPFGTQIRFALPIPGILVVWEARPFETLRRISPPNGESTTELSLPTPFTPPPPVGRAEDTPLVAVGTAAGVEVPLGEATSGWNHARVVWRHDAPARTNPADGVVWMAVRLQCPLTPLQDSLAAAIREGPNLGSGSVLGHLATVLDVEVDQIRVVAIR